MHPCGRKGGKALAAQAHGREALVVVALAEMLSGSEISDLRA